MIRLGLGEGTFKDETFIQDHFESAEEYRKFPSEWQDDENIKKYL